MKRLFDVAGALGGLVFFAPVMALTAAAILLDEGGPILFRQVRIGAARRPFMIVKFRSMRGGHGEVRACPARHATSSRFNSKI